MGSVEIVNFDELDHDSELGNVCIRDMPEDVYHAAPGFNQSGSSLLLSNPAKWLWQKSQPYKSSTALALGTLVHLLLLENERFHDEVVYEPDFTLKLKKVYSKPKGTKEYEKLRQDWLSTIPANSIIVSLDQAPILRAIEASVKGTTNLKNLLTVPGNNELSAFWHNDFGVACRARFDRECSVINSIIDVKTTAKGASQIAFGKMISERGYDIQAAHYLEGARYCGLENLTNFVYLVCETIPPYHVASYRLSQFDIEVGTKKLHQIYKVFKLCSEADIWPSFADEVKEVSQPNYGKERAERAVRSSEILMMDTFGRAG